MAIVYYCLSMTLFEIKVHSSIHALADESISTSSSSIDVLLPYSLDSNHLANFCSHINPLACLTVIDSLSDKVDYSSAAQDLTSLAIDSASSYWFPELAGISLNFTKALLVFIASNRYLLYLEATN